MHYDYCGVYYTAHFEIGPESVLWHLCSVNLFKITVGTIRLTHARVIIHTLTAPRIVPSEDSLLVLTNMVRILSHIWICYVSRSQRPIA